MVNHYGGQVISDLTTMYLLNVIVDNQEPHKYNCKTNLYLIKHARGEYAHVTKLQMSNHLKYSNDSCVRSFDT